LNNNGINVLSIVAPYFLFDLVDNLVNTHLVALPKDATLRADFCQLLRSDAKIGSEPLKEALHLKK
jgi:hypothetical protein